MSKSPYVSQLLTDLVGKEALDRRALVCLAAHALSTLQPLPRAVELHGEPLFVMGRWELSQLLVNADFGRWFASTWLDFKGVGNISGDKPLVDPEVIPGEAFQRLTDTVLRQLEASGAATAVSIDNLKVFGMSPRGIAQFLDVTRTTAHDTPEWQSYAGEQPSLPAPDAGAPRAVSKPQVRRRRP